MHDRYRDDERESDFLVRPAQGASGSGKPIIRFRLLEDLLVCETARATIMLEVASGASASASGDTGNADCTCAQFVVGPTITISDRIGKVGDSLLADFDSNGIPFIPAGTMGQATRFADTPSTDPQTYEAIGFGEAVCGQPSASTSASASGPTCIDVQKSVLGNIPFAGPDEKPQWLLGMNTHHCLEWFYVGSCPDAPTP